MARSINLGLASSEREYMRFLLKYQRAFADLLREGLARVLPSLQSTITRETPEGIRVDSRERYDGPNVEKTIAELLADTEETLMRLFPDSTLRKWATAMSGNVNQKAKTNVAYWVADAMKGKGSLQDPRDLSRLMHDRDLTPFFQNVVDENVGLIRSISAGQLPALKNALVSAITADQTHATITKILMDKLGVSKQRAKLIAVDQVNKLNGRLQQYRQQNLGGKRYVWKTVEDGAVRDDHKKLDGKTFSWSNPPISNRKTGARNHPGGDFRCRCSAEMVVEDVLE